MSALFFDRISASAEDRDAVREMTPSGLTAVTVSQRESQFAPIVSVFVSVSDTGNAECFEPF